MTELKDKNPKSAAQAVKLPLKTVPESLDWRIRGVTGPIKDQASCGSCFVFSVAAMLEGRVNVQLGLGEAQLRVSEQQLLSCLWTYGGEFDNEGCNGGFTMTVFDEILA